MSRIAWAGRYGTTKEGASSRRSFVTVFVLSLLISAFGETLAYTRAGFWGVVLISIIVVGLILAKKRLLGICLFFSVALNISEYSRDITSTTGFYSMRTVVFLGNSLAVWLLILTAGSSVLFLGRRKMSLLFANGFIGFWSLGMLWFVAVGAANCLWGGNPWSYFLTEVRLPVFILLSYVAVWCQPVAGQRWIATVLMTAVLARPFATTLAHLLSLTGTYGGVWDIATYAPLSFLGVAIFALFFVGKQHVIPRWIVWLCVLAETYVLTFQPSGKDFFTLVIVILLGTMAGIKGQHAVIKVAGTLAVVVPVTLLVVSVFSQGRISPLAAEKISQVLSLLRYGFRAVIDPKWAYAISASPQVRVLEFANIIRDLAQSMLGLLFGRGAGGSFSDWRYPFVFVGGAFSATEWNTGLFYWVHESLNFVLLKFGIVGLVVWFIAVLHLLRRLRAQRDTQQYFLALSTVLIVLFMLGFSVQIQMFLGAALGLAAMPSLTPLVPNAGTGRAAASALPGG